MTHALVAVVRNTKFATAEVVDSNLNSQKPEVSLLIAVLFPIVTRLIEF